MVSIPIFRRGLAAMTLAALALSSLACKQGSSNSSTTPTTPTVKVTGKITYTRVPIVAGDDGKPTGFATDATKFVDMPSRGIRIRMLTRSEFDATDGSKVKQWVVSSYTTTTSDGTYSLSLPQGTEACVEVLSILDPIGGVSVGNTVRLIADPNGIDSTLPTRERPVYALRRAPATTQPTPAGTLPSATVNGDTTLDIKVGLDQAWLQNSDLNTDIEKAVAETTPKASGSRPLAILDSLVDFGNLVADPTPGYPLDLHYRVGSAHPRGTFIEMDPLAYPLSHGVQTGQHLFGAISGSDANDDAFDTGAIYYALGTSPFFKQTELLPIRLPDAALKNLTPESAARHGLAMALPALALKSPYICDIQANGVKVLRDLTQPSTRIGLPYNAEAMAALSWDIILKAAGITAPGKPSDWATLVPSSHARWFELTSPVDTNSLTADTLSLYGQLAHLQADRKTTEAIDMKAIFTDATLTALLQPYGIAWPRPTTGEFATFMDNWGSDISPDDKGNPFVKQLSFSMSEAQPSATGLYPNQSRGEWYRARFTLTKDTPFYLHLTSLPPAGAQLEVHLAAKGLIETRRFDSTSSMNPTDPYKKVALVGQTDSLNPVYVTIHLISPSTLVPSYTPQIQLIPVK